MTTEMTLEEYRAWQAAQQPQRGPNEESEIVTAILDYLRAIGVTAARTQAGAVELKKGGYMHLAPEGWPDITGHVMTRYGVLPLYVEVKTAEGELSAAQKTFQVQAECAGCLHVVATSIDEVRAALIAMGAVTREMLTREVIR